MTKDEYFAAVRAWPWGFSLDVPAEWIAEAWDFPEVQGNLVAGGFVRDVSKTGSLCHSQEYLESLADCLSTDQVRTFYLTIRDACATREEEFRPEFLIGFARHAHAIPPALTRDELAALLGFTPAEAKEYFRVVDAHGALPPPCGLGDGGDDIPF
jgi:hypothetical protein